LDGVGWKTKIANGNKRWGYLLLMIFVGDVFRTKGKGGGSKGQLSLFLYSFLNSVYFASHSPPQPLIPEF
jgi:hypothetical protein